MAETVTPMLHVPDVRATVDWYQSIGFTVRATKDEEGEMNWAALMFGNGEFMLNAGGKPSTEDPREVDLYLSTDRVEALSYGMREFIVGDINGFWITFRQEVAQR